jgi:hypothetical protein
MAPLAILPLPDRPLDDDPLSGSPFFVPELQQVTTWWQPLSSRSLNNSTEIPNGVRLASPLPSVYGSLLLLKNERHLLFSSRIPKIATMRVRSGKLVHWNDMEQLLPFA